jgi:hypothetical protein
MIAARSATRFTELMIDIKRPSYNAVMKEKVQVSQGARVTLIVVIGERFNLCASINALRR